MHGCAADERSSMADRSRLERPSFDGKGAETGAGGSGDVIVSRD